jgi:hypothetical protein
LYFIDLFLHVLFNLLNRSYHHSFDLGDWGFTLLRYLSDPLLCGCWPFEESYSPAFSYLPYFYFEIHLFVFDQLVGGSSHLKSFPWINFYILAGLVIS